MSFQPKASRPTGRASGAASGTVNPGHIAKQLRFYPHGPWLFAYMFRRFGPPNIPSDDHKNLASWCLTTPMKGCFLTVTPYMADDPNDGHRGHDHTLSFGYLFSESLYKRAKTAPLSIRKAWNAWQDRALRWAAIRGLSIVSTDDLDGRAPLNKYHYGEREGPEMWLVWTNKADKNRPVELNLRMLRQCPVWGPQADIAAAYRKSHPRATRPDYPRENPAVIARIDLALARTLLELERPIFVRDVCFGPNGRIQDPAKTSALPYEHAGYACQPILPEPQPKDDPEHAIIIKKYLKPGDTITHTRCMGYLEESIYTGTDGPWLCGKPTRDTKRLSSCAGPANDIAISSVTHINRIPILEIPDAFDRHNRMQKRQRANLKSKLKTSGKSKRRKGDDDIPF